MKRKSMFLPYVFVLLVYVLAFAAGCFTYTKFSYLKGPGAMFAADVAATLAVWLFGVLLKNSSLYDPYWSVAPIVMLFSWLSIRGGALGTSDMLLIAVFLAWGLRLTLNWALSWRGMNHQDWRYTMLHDKSPKLWPVVNLMGINLFPTLIVFVCMIPAYNVLKAQPPANLLTWLGAAICLGAALLQLVSDRQMSAFRSNPENSGKCMDEGLWGLTRHPNYLGEISFWWGIWIMQASIGGAFSTILYPVLMTAMFLYISIPMMEKHLEKRPGYAEYKRRVPMLLPIPRKNTSREIQ